MNTVRSLQSRPFGQLALEEKLEVKRLGLDRPQLLTTSGLSSRLFTKPCTQSTVGLLAAVILEEFIAFLVCFSEILNEKKLGLRPRLHYTGAPWHRFDFYCILMYRLHYAGAKQREKALR